MRPKHPLYSSYVLLGLLIVLAFAGCAHVGQSKAPAEPAAPPTTPEPEPVEPAVDTEALVDDALTRSEEAYLLGLDAYRDGDKTEGRDHFDQSLRALVQVDTEIQGDYRLVAAYRDLLDDLLELEARLDREANGTGLGEAAVGTPADELAEVSDELTPEEEARTHEAAEEVPTEVVYDIPIEFNDKVLRFVDLYQSDWRKQFEAGFRRSGRYIDMVREVFADEGIPQDMAYIAHVESSFKPKAYSRARAYGMFQFMAATGRSYGLRRTQWVDERADPEKAARAAARYLKVLHEMFGDWSLAMAGYNAGEHKVQRAIRYTGSRDFWQLARTRHLRRETSNFVPAIMAAIIIYKSPEEYGFDPATRDEPWTFDRMEVEGQIDLQVLAECADSDVASLRLLNPELRHNTTPPDSRAYEVRVPAGTGQVAMAKLEAVPLDQRVRQVVHVVRQGETLSLLADRYGTSVSSIKSANGIRDPRRIRVGTHLQIPLTDGLYASRSAGPSETDPASGKAVYRVRRGDNPYIIARTHGLRLNDLLAWNGLGKRSVIYPGTHLYLEDPGSAANAVTTAAAPPAGGSTYVVRRGDTISVIAKRQRVSVGDLLAWNGLHSRSIIHPGQRLTVSPGSVAEAAAPTEVAARTEGGEPRAVVHVVKRGDTLYDISRAYSVAVSDLCRWNGISPRKTIYAGDQLTIYQN